MIQPDGLAVAANAARPQERELVPRPVAEVRGPGRPGRGSERKDAMRKGRWQLRSRHRAHPDGHEPRHVDHGRKAQARGQAVDRRGHACLPDAGSGRPIGPAAPAHGARHTRVRDVVSGRRIPEPSTPCFRMSCGRTLVNGRQCNCHPLLQTRVATPDRAFQIPHALPFDGTAAASAAASVKARTSCFTCQAAQIRR